jgi:cell division GTPase FtsZ
MLFYEILQDGTIGLSTNSAKVAEQFGLKLTTDKEIVFGWNNKRYIAGTEPEKPESIKAQERIEELKSKLASTDYVVIKIAEGAATAEEYAKVIAERVAFRKEINDLEKICQN